MTPTPPANDEDNFRQRRRMLLAGLAGAALAGCGGGGGGDGAAAAAAPGAPSNPVPDPSTAPCPSLKRGLAFDLNDAADYAGLQPGVSWWYDWGLQASGAGASATFRRLNQMEFVPMLWNGTFDQAEVIRVIQEAGDIRHLLVVNEPNLINQANMSPAQVADLWPRVEAIAAATGVQIVGPQMTWGTMAGFEDPAVWLDAFMAEYRSRNLGREPRIDCLGFHWYDYGLSQQLDRLARFGKPFWVTEMANWHQGDGPAQIDSEAKQAEQMRDMVGICEQRQDVVRYAWFTGRQAPDPHFSSVLSTAPGVLTPLGQKYLALPG